MKKLKINKLFSLLEKNNIKVSFINNYAKTSFITMNNIEINNYFIFSNEHFIEFVNNFNETDEILNIDLKNLTLNEILSDIMFVYTPNKLNPEKSEE
jgi:hypothetical protein